eukprot:Ihof_evm7s175 gene=Ihof_evmTU7s175
MASNSDNEDSFGTRRAKRNRGTKENDDTASALRRLKEAKEGKKVAYDFENEDDDLFEEVDETEYKRRMAENADEFVVDDDGKGYQDDGRDWWEEEHNYSGEEEEAMEDRPGKKANKDNKKKNVEKKDPRQRSINSLFTNVAKKSVVSTAASIKALDSVNDSFLTDLLDELKEDPEDKKIEAKSQKKIDTKSALDAAMFASPAEARQLLQTSTSKHTTISTPLANRKRPSIIKHDLTPTHTKTLNRDDMEPMENIPQDETPMEVDEEADIRSLSRPTDPPKVAPQTPYPEADDNTPVKGKSATKLSVPGLKIKEVSMDEELVGEDEEDYSSFNPSTLNANLDWWK